MLCQLRAVHLTFNSLRGQIDPLSEGFLLFPNFTEFSVTRVFNFLYFPLAFLSILRRVSSMRNVVNNSPRYHCALLRKPYISIGPKRTEDSDMWNALNSLLKSRCIPQVPLYILLRRLVLNIYSDECVCVYVCVLDLRMDRLVCIGSHPCISPPFFSRTFCHPFPLPVSLPCSLFE